MSAFDSAGRIEVADSGRGRIERRIFLATCAAGVVLERQASWYAAAQAPGPTVTVDGRTIGVDAVEFVAGMTPSMQFDMTKALAAQPAFQFQNGNAQQPAQAGGVAGGVGGGVGGAGGGGGRGVAIQGGVGFSGPLAKYGLALSVVAGNAKAGGKAIEQLVEIAPEVKAIDDNGDTLEPPPLGPLSLHFPDFEQRHVGKQYLYLRADKRPRMSLKTLDGELVITPGRNVVVEFAAPIAGKTTKKAFQETFTLDSLQAGPDGIRVTASFPAPKNQAPPPANMQQFMQMSMRPNDKNSYFVEVVDSDGAVYFPSGGGSGGGAQMTNFSFGVMPAGPGKPARQRQAAVLPISRSFDFAPLPPGRSLKAVRLRWIERTGPPRRVPFQLRDIPLPG